MDLKIVNPDPRYGTATLIEPTTHGYIHIAAAVRPGRLPFVLPNRARSRVLARLKERAAEVERLAEVVKVTVFRAVAMPPTARSNAYLKRRATSLHYANFDVAVLIETTSPATAREVQTTPAYGALVADARSNAAATHIIAARNGRRIGDVDTARPGLFLFNHFAAADAGVMLELWEYLAGWYVVETGLDNSVALVPLEGEPADYAVINWARWEGSLLRHFWRQVAKRSFWRYVTPNLEANQAGSMPIYYRLA